MRHTKASREEPGDTCHVNKPVNKWRIMHEEGEYDRMIARAAHKVHIAEQLQLPLTQGEKTIDNSIHNP